MKRLDTKSFMEKSVVIHGNKYDYSCSIYINNRTKIKIVCQKHGAFYQKPNNHLLGQGCPECANRKKMDTKTFIAKAKYVHHNKYDYSVVEYINNKVLVSIICNTHGIFIQTPNDHLSGKGCMACSGKQRLTTEEFVVRSNIIHDNKYNYILVNYTNNQTEVEIICPYHGSFWQTPSSHLSGRNCSKCSYNCISKMETDWLNKICIPIEYRQKSITISGKKYRVDAFDPATNTIYEFYGDYWHGNPLKYNRDHINPISKKTFGELYDKTIDREEIYKYADYKVVSVWEADFKKGCYNAT